MTVSREDEEAVAGEGVAGLGELAFCVEGTFVGEAEAVEDLFGFFGLDEAGEDFREVLIVGCDFVMDAGAEEVAEGGGVLRHQDFCEGRGRILDLDQHRHGGGIGRMRFKNETADTVWRTYWAAFLVKPFRQALE
ncbi:MAG: hypothetical protein NTW74_02240 [Acidobacteria bacterium]|nr:hypothetical protein [Acidobacteriota bacterium]